MHTNLETLIISTAAAIMAASCSARQTDTTAPRVSGDRVGVKTVAGNWAHTGIGPVYREFMTLSQTGDRISGTGTYAIEAGREGPTTIDGTLVGKTMSLTITRDYGLRESFTGTLTDASHVVGRLTIDGYAQVISYSKQ